MKVVELFQSLNEYRQKIQSADLSNLAQGVWAAKNTDAKKAALYAMINAYKFKENQKNTVDLLVPRRQYQNLIC